MVFKLLNAASKTWRRLKGTNQLPKVIGGVRFQDGIEVIEVPARRLIASSPKIPHSSVIGPPYALAQSPGEKYWLVGLESS